MLTIVIPMSGRGSRFVKAGYKTPKPFILLEDGTPMIQRVVENLTPLEPYRFVFIARREHECHIKEHLSFANDVIYVDEVTEGAACTVLLAKGLIDPNEPLIIANSDQEVTWSSGKRIRSFAPFTWRESNTIQDFINHCRLGWYSGGIATFQANHPKWSYARLNNDGDVVEVAEKRVISSHATVGVYYFRCARLFINAANQMITKDIRVNGEFYVCPVFNELLADILPHKIAAYPVEKMTSLGTPEDLEAYLDGKK